MSTVISPTDVFTEPDADPDTLKCLGPLRALAGVWEGKKGHDEHLVAAGSEEAEFHETIELQPIDPQTNGPQLLYGLRYHQHVVKTGAVETFHDQVGYLLWEPERERVVMTLAIPRAQVAMATGPATADATTFTLRADEADRHSGISSNDFLDHAFRTPTWTITFRIRPGDTWAYSQTTILDVRGRGPFEHTDAGLLARTGPPVPNPLAAQGPA
jgi:hypothetical protein